jgi:type IV pilus assembly protein PilM
MCDSNQIEGKRVIASLPAPAVFTKRIQMPKQDEDELRNSVQFEAANFIPHKIDAVKLDYAVLGESGKNQLDVLVVAVKKELLETMEDCLALAGLEYALADVDFFALHNVFQYNYPELVESTSAILSIGYRYTSICISRGGLPLFVGDVSIGLKQLEEELCLKVGVPEAQARSAIQTLSFIPEWESVVSGFIEQSAQELSRQISFFWNTCGVDGSIAKVFVAGGGVMLPNLLDTLGRKTGISCEGLDPLLKVSPGNQVDKGYLAKVSPLLAVAAGLGLRAL